MRCPNSPSTHYLSLLVPTQPKSPLKYRTAEEDLDQNAPGGDQDPPEDTTWVLHGNFFLKKTSHKKGRKDSSFHSSVS
jgi:hypothetical protein